MAFGHELVICILLCQFCHFCPLYKTFFKHYILCLLYRLWNTICLWFILFKRIESGLNWNSPIPTNNITKIIIQFLTSYFALLACLSLKPIRRIYIDTVRWFQKPSFSLTKYWVYEKICHTFTVYSWCRQTPNTQYQLMGVAN